MRRLLTTTALTTAALAASAAPAAADPVSLIAGFIVTFGSGTALVTSIGIGGLITLGNVIGTLIVGGGLFALQSSLTDRMGPFRGASNSPEVRGSVKQARPLQRLVFGETRIGGAFFLYDVKPPYLYVGLLHSALPITEYVQLYVGETAVALDATGNPTSPPYLTQAGANRLRVKTQSGLSLTPALNQLVSSDFPELPSNFKLPGIANSVFRFHYGADFDEFQALWGQTQIPAVTWIVRGTPVPDPRNPAHRLDFDPRDPSDLWNAVNTWDYSNTAALIQAFWALMPFGLNAGPAAIDWDAVAAAAEFDEESVPTKAGDWTKRHTIDGAVSLGEKPLDVMEGMLTANRGFVSVRAGRVRIVSSQPQRAKFTITDDMMVGGMQYRDARPKRDLVNVARCSFQSPERNYQEVDGPELRRSDLITTHGEELEQTWRLPFTSRHERAQRIVKANLDDAQLGRTLSCLTTLAALGLVEGDVVQVWSRLFPQINGLYQIETWQLADDFSGLAVQMIEYDPDIARDWNMDEDEQDFELEAEL